MYSIRSWQLVMRHLVVPITLALLIVISFLVSGEPVRRSVRTPSAMTSPSTLQGIDFTQTRDEDPRLKQVATELASHAHEHLTNGRPSSAGLEALRSISISKSTLKANDILGYKEGLHPRAYDLTKRGMIKSDLGWIDKKERPADSNTTAPITSTALQQTTPTEWQNARTFTYTFVSISSNLSPSTIARIGSRVDWVVEFLRAQYCNVPGYKEPLWPIQLRIPANECVYNRELKEFGLSTFSPYGVCLYPDSPYVYINGERALKEGGPDLAGIPQHEATHAFFCMATEFDRKRINTAMARYSWLIEAVCTYYDYVTPDKPLNEDFIRRHLERFRGDSEFSRLIERVESGASVLLTLGSSSDIGLDYKIGPFVTAFACDNGKRDVLARIVVDFYRGRLFNAERRFDELECSTDSVSKWFLNVVREDEEPRSPLLAN